MILIENMKAEDFLPLIEDNFIDLIVTSPPYDDLRNYDGNNEWDFNIISDNCVRVLRDGGVLVWIVGDQVFNGGESLSSFKQCLHFCEVLGMKLHDTMIYKKSGTSFPDKTRYHQNFEYMFVLSKGKPKTINLIKDRPNKFVGAHGGNKRGGLINRGEFGVRFNVWEYSTGKNNTTKDDFAFRHPAMFPEGLAMDHIISWSNEGDIVLDPFLGSGTTLKAAKQLGRNGIGCEPNIEYYKIALERCA